ncbi:glycosyltransferase family 39 protein [Nocardioides sp. SOB77]|uniref:Glycosyltransferase family 39 protein n=1 Tax=Nocardioides oceani TaxID=3058369 RepID=A0ABT8FAC8_9ACTN|nr:glycosyltransferase family 39 protein [Nocardioides oceani]MDN4171459.1 glycosyltransferase family 39 protein [Nocardioides oceani]
MTPAPTPAATRSLALVAAAVAALLLVTAGGYGPHRDELYFVLVGGDPAWGYVDQPPLVPVLAHAWDAVTGGHLWLFRAPSALAAGATAWLGGLVARRLGAGPGAQVLAAAVVGLAPVTLAVGHLVSTSTYDLLVEVGLLLLVLRALEDPRWWWAAGLLLGVGLQVKTLPALLAASVVLALLLAGPRHAFRSPHLYAAGLVSAALWAPNLVWQQAHGWPQLELAESIAAGGSGTSAGLVELWATQPGLVGPPVGVVLAVVGAVRLARSREHRFILVTWVVLAVLVTATGGKPYYLAPAYVPLLAAGAIDALVWAGRGAARLRRSVLGAGLALGVVVGAVLFLPLVPAEHLHRTPVVAVNYDAGETVGWPAFVAAVEEGLDAAGPGAVVVTGNYGEAGAVARWIPDVPVHSGHNALWDLGPPAVDDATAVVVGYAADDLERWCGSVAEVTRVDNGLDLDNDEQGRAVLVCRHPVGGWSAVWPRLRRLG